MKHILTILLVLICCTSYAQDNSLYTKQLFIQQNDTLPYRLLLPINYDKTKTYPLVIFLHGSGERGNDNEAQLSHGAALFLRDSIRQKYPAIIVFPQCALSSYWSNVSSNTVNGQRIFSFKIDGEPSVAMNLLLQLYKKLKKQYPINKKQIYVGGLSMGGMGTFEIVRRLPKTFAAAMPICGGADVATANKLTKTNWWVFHGSKDDVVNPQLSKDMAAAIQAMGGKVKLTIYENANHNSWDNAFAEPTFMHWMFAQQK